MSINSFASGSTVIESSGSAKDQALAVVLGGGGELGSFQVGVIDALATHGVEPALLVGTSVGALNAAFWAFHPGAGVGAQLLQAWLDSDPAAVLTEPRWRWLPRVIVHHGRLLGRARLARLIARRFGAQTLIEEARIPLAVVATDLDSGRRVALRTGNLQTALLASSAIPGLFAPVPVDGRLLVDGGLVANCDLETAAEAGMRRVIVVDPNGEILSPPADDLIAVLEQALAVAVRRQTDLEIAALRDRLQVALLRPTLRWAPCLLDGSHTLELVAMGQVAGQAFLSRGPSSDAGHGVKAPDGCPRTAALRGLPQYQ